MNIHLVLVNWIIAFLSGLYQRYQRVKLGGCASRWIKAGVPQGTKLGPLLFLIMINDFKPTNDTIKFVDDSSIIEVVLMGVPGGGRRGRQPPPPPSLLGKQSQSGNIRFTVGQYWLIIKINGTNSVNFVGNMLSNRSFS